MKKIIITLLLLLSSAIPVLSQNQFWYKGFLFEVNGHYEDYGVKLIAANDGSYSGIVTIPDIVSIIVTNEAGGSGGGQYEVTYPVIQIADNAFAGCTDVTEVVIPSSVAKVGQNAFNGCTALTRVTIRNEFCDIGDGAFAGCTSLVHVALPKHVSSLGTGVFEGCTGLATINLPSVISTLPSKTFYGCTSLASITLPRTLKTIESSAFAYCTSLNNVVIPNSVTRLGSNVFYSCTGLTHVTLSQNLSSLDGTFLGCTALTTVNIPLKVTTMYSTFKGCTNLTSINIPPMVNEIGYETFAGCSSLSHIDLPNSLTKIGIRAFSNTALTSVVLPSTVTRIEGNAFEGCTGLMSVTCRNLNPPYMSNSEGFAAETYGLAALNIPAVSVTRYQNANWWKLFENIEGKVAYNTTYDFVADEFIYLITGSNTVSVCGGNDDATELTIPSTVTSNGVTYTVTGIASYAFMGSRITSLNLPSTLTTIGEKAFSGCDGLTTLTIPENVTSIGANAFEGLNNLSRIEWNARECWTSGIPYSVYQYGKYYGHYDYEYYMADYNDVKTSLTQLIIGDQVKVLPDGLAACSQITSIDLPESLEVIGDNTFYMCGLLTSVTIPVNVVDMGVHAFCNCEALTSLTWNARSCPSYGGLYYPITYDYDYPTGYDDDTHEGSSSLTQITIGDQVELLPANFARSSSITSIQLPASLRIIGDYAFLNCWNVVGSLIIGDEVTEIGVGAFGGCARVTSMTVGRNVASIGKGAFGMGSEYNSSDYYVESVPSMNLTSLVWNARQCETAGNLQYGSLNMLQIDDHVEVLPDGFGCNTYGLTSVDLPSSLRVIGNRVFKYCPWIQELTLPSTVTAIGDEAFYNCSQLRTVTLPEGLKSVGSSAFVECYALSDLTLPNTLETIGPKAFSNCGKLIRLDLPASVTDFGNQAFSGCSSMAAIVVDDQNPVYDSRDNCNAVIRTADNEILLTCKNTTIPSGITAINDYAFYQNNNLTGIDIPSTVVYVGKYAFAGCYNLTSITLPNSVTTLGEHAFEGCSGLKTVNLSQSLDTIQPFTFCWCDSLSSITIPNSVKRIGNSAFYGCRHLTSVTLSQSVTQLEPYTFAYCNQLTGIEIPASVSSISRSTFDDTDLNAVVVDSENTVFDSRDNCNAIIETASNNLYMGFDSSFIPATVTSIGDSAFLNKYGLQQIVIPNSVKTIGNSAFDGCGGLKSIEIGSSVKVIGTSNFRFCSRLESLVIPNTVDSIGYQAFEYCRRLKDLTLSTSIKGIGSWAFAYCDSLHSVTIPNSTKSIGDYAFFNSGLTSLTIGTGVEFIGYDAFYGYYARLAHINCLAKIPPTISSYTFYSTTYDNATLCVPEASIDAYKTANNWKKFKNIVGIPGAGPGDVDGDGVIGVNDVTLLVDNIIAGQLSSVYADVNGDGVVDILDVTLLIDQMLWNSSF